MEIHLKELLNSINTRFTGPQSCRLHDMITGRIEFDDEEVSIYLRRLKDFGGTNGSYKKQSDSKDAKVYLERISEYVKNRDKKRI